MKVAMKIIGRDTKKESPLKPDFTIYEVSMVPMSLFKAEDKGRGILAKIGLQEMQQMYDSITTENIEVFKARIPMTKAEWDKQNYRIDDIVLLEVVPSGQ